MKINIDKSLILSKIKLHYGFKSDAEFAKFLGIKPATLSNWSSRNTIDYERVYTICKDIDANWLLSGVGPMLKSEKNYQQNDDKKVIASEPLVNVEYSKNEVNIWKDKYLDVVEKYNALLELRVADWLEKNKYNK